MKTFLQTVLNYLAFPGTCTILAFLGLFVGKLADVPWWVWPLSIPGIPFLPFTFLAFALDEPAGEVELEHVEDD